MTTTNWRLTYLLFPRDDDRLSALVESLVRADGSDADRLERQLRTIYPRAVVRKRDPLGELNPAAETWYVYRDGSPATVHPVE